jgi:hypothetical protein
MTARRAVRCGISPLTVQRRLLACSIASLDCFLWHIVNINWQSSSVRAPSQCERKQPGRHSSSRWPLVLEGSG